MATITEFERYLAENMASAAREHTATEGVHFSDSRRDVAVIAWRKWGHLLTSYIGGGPVAAFMNADTDVDKIAGKLSRGSRFNRCRPDGTADLNADSVREWEFGLVHDLVSMNGSLDMAREYRATDALSRIGLERSIVVGTLAAYTGISEERVHLMSRGLEWGRYDGTELYEEIGTHRPVR